MEYTQLQSVFVNKEMKSDFQNLISEVESKFNHQVLDNMRKSREQLLKTSLKKQDIVLVGKIIQGVGIDNQPTNLIYDIYKQLCGQLQTEPMSAIGFSRFVSKWFGYSIKNKKMSGKKQRIFVKDNGGLK